MMSKLPKWSKQQCSICTEVWHTIWYIYGEGVCPRCYFKKRDGESYGAV